jgi:hypothetical protein
VRCFVSHALRCIPMIRRIFRIGHRSEITEVACGSPPPPSRLATGSPPCMDAFSDEMFDGQEEYEIMKYSPLTSSFASALTSHRAIKLSLRNYLARGSHASTSSMMAGCCTSSSASTRPKRPLDSSADSVQEKKKRKLDLHTEALKCTSDHSLDGLC